MTRIEQVLVFAALAEDGKATADSIGQAIEASPNSVSMQATRLRGMGHIEKANGKGAIVPTKAGYKKACQLLGVSR